MTLKLVKMSVHVCDRCGGSPQIYQHTACLSCSQEYCYECRKTQGKEYHHGVFIAGSGDGFYCNECDAVAAKAGDLLHAAYRKIESLRREYHDHDADFQKRKKIAEDKLQSLLHQSQATT